MHSKVPKTLLVRLSNHRSMLHRGKDKTSQKDSLRLSDMLRVFEDEFGFKVECLNFFKERTTKETSLNGEVRGEFISALLSGYRELLCLTGEDSSLHIKHIRDDFFLIIIYN